MHNPAQAYGQTARVVSNPREHEANLLIKAAKQLQAVKEPFDPRSDKFRDAVTYNRKLWSIFASSVVGDDNPLPDQIKQNIANLGIFVMKHTVSVQASPAPEKLDVLININREIAAGLYSKPA
ncbi:flagellar biosynthesis regulator FlaF [Pyruvatibacter mobilis]|jgi:flagellar protein FlaF|uniref:Flagellar biosynthesis regulator FlaF n=1 Tax=Pyruvatibacter mobilis TaxID=1712261 RepID=A0A845QD28_9HYPH|nr:flagellar biosynthesis regulator FlaF [Pyruvatibacter mobilis]NBG96482.1 flagellar biosynthesis regulator FlaF [Pyruvatibacter mobilis]QJD74624.1 flagellar biosynthesis regulator FlaF [Pyruvatibacter mobilis]GGD08782.1 flagellar biosynthesis regulatory protein FlaF [Pyruvatibacter mobilis]